MSALEHLRSVAVYKSIKPDMLRPTMSTQLRTENGNRLPPRDLTHARRVFASTNERP